MPVSVPPSPASVVAPLARSVLSPMETHLPSDLQATYAETLKTWGGRWLGVQLVSSGAALPPGLQALLNRENPALSLTMAHQGQGARFVFDPSLSEEQQALALKQMDHHVLSIWEKEGWLTTKPSTSNQVSFDPAEGSDAGRVFTDRPSITMAGAPQNVLPKEILARGVDPVALRWFILAHEASHLQQLTMSHVFHESSWSPEQNAAMNLLLFDVKGDQSMTSQVYAESFADVYGAMMALSLTRNAPVMQRTLATFLSFRQETTKQEDQAFDAAMKKGVDPVAFLTASEDPHRTAPALRQMLADAKSGTLDLAHLSPAELREKAEGYASTAVVAFLRSPMGQAIHEWSWGRDQNLAQGLSNPNQSTANQERGRLAQYLMQRMLVYETDARHGTLTPPSVQADPMLAHFEARDSQWRARYLNLPKVDREAMQKLFATGDSQLTPGLNAYFNQAQASMASFLTKDSAALHQTLSKATTEVEEAVKGVPRQNGVPRGSTLGARLAQVFPSASPKVSTDVNQRMALSKSRRITP